MAKGIEPIPWYTHGANTRNCPVDARNVISEVESDDDRRGALESYPLIPPTTRRAIVTDFNGFKDPSGVWRPDLAQPFVEQGVTCITEAYLPDGPTHNPATFEFSAKVMLGFRKVQHAFGLYNGRPESTKPGQPFTFEDYAQWLNMPVWWVWTAESPGVI